MLAILAGILTVLVSLGWLDRSNDVVDDMLIFSLGLFFIHFGWDVGVSVLSSRTRKRAE